jgi:ABC-type multidrug transport system ATPase subunit
LWNELTAEEHLEIFADLKGVPRQLRSAVIKDKLESVGLYGVRDKKVRLFVLYIINLC